MAKFYFTFGSNHLDADGNSLGNCVAVVEADDYGSARQKMFEARGSAWSFQYTNSEDAGVERFGLIQLTLDEVAL